jgi:RHS repeat-associated protein
MTKYFRKMICLSVGLILSMMCHVNANAARASGPTITIQPVSVTVMASATATFTVAATSTSAITYQWKQAAPSSNKYAAISGAISASYTTPPTTIAMSGTKYQCVVSNSTGSVTSNTATLTVTNSVPVVNITSPANNSIFTAGSTMTITVDAFKTGGTIQSVDFFNGDTFLGSDSSAPFSYTISKASVGKYTLTARANDGTNTTISSPIAVTVQGTPVVNIVSPQDQNTFTTGSLNITAIATEDFGAIVNVSLYRGSTLLTTINSLSQAFTYSWINIPSGTYTLTAVATDVIGATVTSAPITFTINAVPFSTVVDDNLATTTDALNHTTSYLYDNLNRLLKTTFADGSTVSSTYDAFGNQTTVTDQRGKVVTKTYDPFERISKIQDPNGGLTQFSYDTEGRLLTLTDANSKVTAYTYDANGKMLTEVNPLNLTTTLTYDVVGNLASRQDAKGNKTNYTYDALNRLTSTSYPDGTSIANIYDALSRITSMTDVTGSTSYTYDPLDRLLSKTSPGNNNAISYTYDGEGNRLTSLDQTGRTITNTYDALNRLASVQDQNGITTYQYDANSNKIAVTSPNGVVEHYTYDPLNRMLSAVIQNGSTVLSSYTNVYDIAGMITKKTFADGSWSAYTYDSLNQLLSETRQTSASTVYSNLFTYDLLGNRLTSRKDITLGNFWNADSLNMPSSVLTSMTNAGYGKTANPTTSISLVNQYTHDSANRLTKWDETITVSSSTFPVQATYTYDNNGNRTNKAVSSGTNDPSARQTSYTYDFENRLNQLTYVNNPNLTGTQTDQIVYNGEGLRIRTVLHTTPVNFAYDGSNVLAERDANGNTTKTYTRATGFSGGISGLLAQNFTSNNSPAVQYFHYNDLGSVANLSGTTTNSYDYDAFGNLLTAQSTSDTNRYAFSTKEFDSRAGLYYFGGRYYDPEVGRWLTTDPLGFEDGMNLYAYVNNNPLNLIDAHGFLGERINEFLSIPEVDVIIQYPFFLGLGTKIKGIVTAEKAISTAKVTVIGHMPEYINVAKKMGANYLKALKDWNWQKQGDFIKSVIQSTDNVYIGTPIREGPSVLKKEIKQLIKAGFKPIEQGSKLLINPKNF